MKTPVLERLGHRGTVSAEGFVFSFKLLSEEEIYRRILDLWQPNAKVFRYPNGLIFLSPESFRVDCRYAVGLPLVRLGEILAGFPIREKDAEFFKEFGETIAFSEAGEIKRLSFGDLEEEKVEDRFDVSNFQVVETQTLGEILAKPVIVENVESVNLREELKGIPKADEKLSEIIQVLSRKKAEAERAKKTGGGSGVSSANYGSLTSGFFGGIFDSLKNLFSSGESGGSGGGQGWQNSEPDKPKPPSVFKKMFARAMFQLKIGQIIGREQAKYLMQMMEMFERGDLDEALKHAIPLEDMQSLKEMSESLPSFSFLRPRSSLQINFGRQTSSNSAVHLEENWFAELQKLYRQTFERLVAQNRIEEAAFVLAELLKSNHEAVEFLEKHGKFRLAAELAESRDLSKETIVRQWFLAGETRRAVQLAVLHNCFEYVVTQLEKQNHPQAAELREIWAKNLAESGDYAAAVNVIWQLENKRETAKDWIEKVIRFGGVTSARMLAKKVSLFPEEFESVKVTLQEFLTENADEAKEKRAAFAGEILRLDKTVELKTLARPLVRKLLSDAVTGSPYFSLNEFNRLVEYAQHYPLRTDLPKVSPEKPGKISEPLNLVVSPNDKGATAVYDACLLPDGKLAVALGEAGIKIISKTGKTIAHFDQPTEKFIVSDLGTKAVCLARRGRVWRLAKINFVERKASYWCDATFTEYAETFDGNLWFIGNKDEVYAVDTNSKTFESFWRVAELGGEIYEISRSASNLVLLIFTPKGFEKWRYDLPNFTLRSRNETKYLEMKNESEKFLSASSSVSYAAVQIFDEAKNQFCVRIFDYETQIAGFELDADTKSINKSKVVGDRFFVQKFHNAGQTIKLFQTPNLKIAEINLPETTPAFVRLDTKYLNITDEFGRVVIFDHQAKFLRKNSRI